VVVERYALPVEPQTMHLKQHFPKEIWEQSEEGIRKSLERDWAIRLWEWIREQPGEVQIGVRRESLVVSHDWLGGLGDGITLWWEIKATPLGHLVPGEFYFYGGSMHGRWMATDGAWQWKVPLMIPEDLMKYGTSSSEIPVIIEVYERDGGIYRHTDTRKQ